MDSQCRLANTGVICGLRPVLVKSLAAAFCTNWSRETEERFKVWYKSSRRQSLIPSGRHLWANMWSEVITVSHNSHFT